jgi:adenosylmethionine-8-amino-7-oxononanoate aminotransferase
LVGEVRGVGLIGAIELVADKDRRANFDPRMKVGGRLAALCEANGVIGRALSGDVLAFSPPLIITAAEIDEMLDAVAAALDTLTEQIQGERN